MTATTRQTVLRRVLLACILIFDLYVGHTVFYSPLDDWQWSMDMGIQWWLTGMLNGRYVGNLVAVVLTRSVLLKTLSIGLGLFILPYLMARLLARGRRERILVLFVTCNAGMFLVPSMIWRETFFWVSAFGNFVVPTAGFLALLLLLRRADRQRTHLWAWCGLLLVYMALLGQFLENLALLFVGACLLMLLLSLRDSFFRTLSLAMLAGSLIAAFFMFCNSNITDLVETGNAVNSYRRLSFSLEDGLAALVYSVLRQYLGELLPRAFDLGPYLALPLATIIFLGFWNSPCRPACLLALFPIIHNLVVLKTQVVISRPGWIASCISWSLPLLALLVNRTERRVKGRWLLLYFAAPLSLLPLAFTSSLVYRHFFFPMILLIVVAVDLAQPILFRRWGWVVPAVMLVGLMLRWGLPCPTINGCTRLQEELIAQARETGADTLVLPTDRFQFTVWWARNPWDVEKSHYFCQVHGLSDDITLIFLPVGSYETWPDISQEQWDARVELHPSPDYTPVIPIP